MTNKQYLLPELPYGLNDLEPFISKEQLALHHQKHHAAYIKGANAIFEKLEKARREEADLDIKAISKELSFHVGGHILHSLFWENLAPPGQGVGEAQGRLAESIEDEFGSFERFKKEFSQAALSVEGSGWAVLAYDDILQRLMILQIEKHNVNFCPGISILLALDLWEHAYYLDYKNERAKFIEACWKIINWGVVGKRFNGG